MDIRKFFTASSQGRSSAFKSGSKDKDSRIHHSKEKSRKRVAVLSDSDSESPLPRSERTKVKKRIINDDSDSEDVERTNSAKKSKEESKLKLTDVDDFFGSTPVRRQNKSNTSRRKDTIATKNKEALNNSKDVACDRTSVETKIISNRVTHSEKSPIKGSPQKKAYGHVNTNKGSTPNKINSKKELSSGESKCTHKITETEFVTPGKKYVDHQKEPNASTSIQDKGPNTPISIRKLKLPDKGPNTPTSIRELKLPDKEPNTSTSVQELKLPNSKNESEKKRAHFRQYLDRKGPQALGSKDIPEGRPGCLSGLTFVITGVLESFERDETKEMIERYKGKITTSLSKNTSYLVVGREPGPAKVEKAQKFGTRILDENQLLELIATSGKHADSSKLETIAPCSSPRGKNIDSPKKEVSVHQNNQIEKSIFSSSEETSTEQKINENNVSPVVFTKVTKRKTSDKATDRDIASAEPQLHKKARKSLSNFISAASKSNETADALKDEVDGTQQIDRSESQLFKMWVDKYKPSTTKQIIGQQGDRSNMKKLQQWLLSWHKNHGDGKKPAASKWHSKDDGTSYKAALLSGPPGVGKTTTAQLICKECKFDYTELNASDTRSKKSLKELVEGTVSNKTLISYACGEIQNGVSAHHAIIMDEVDGMAGTQDRGGVQELIALIKSSKIPIICICNDRSSPKIRSLSNYCYDLRFQRPRVEQIKSSLMSIAYKENIQLAPNVLQDIIVASNQDIRQVLHSLSLWCAKKQLTADQAKCDIGKGIKNVNISPFEALRKVFSHSEAQHMSIHDKTELFFTDYSLIPLFVQENYISVQPFEAKRNIVKHLQLLSGAADSICDGDLVEKYIRTNNNWGLLPVEAVYASVIPGEIMSGNLTQMINFPSWLGKNSTVNHMKRILQQLHGHMRLRISANKTDLHLDQLAVLRNAITRPLVEREVDGINESISILSNYCLLREDVDSIIELTHWPGKKNPMLDISPKVKSAFTRMYNKEGTMNPYSVVNIKKSRKRESNSDLLAEGDDVDEISDDGSDNDISTDAMVKVKKTTKKRTDDSIPKKKGRTKK